MKLENKVAIITGGSNGIGFEMAKLFSSEGAKVVALDINDYDTKQSGVEFMKLDVSSYNDCERVYNEIIAKYGKVDILVNNAGITKDGLTAKMTEEMWDAVINVNLKGVFNLTKFVGPQMQSNGYGSILNIASVVGEFGNIGQANYSATKAGLMGLTKTWAKEFSRKGENVRVNAIAPGYVMTDILKTVPQDLLDKFAAMTMLKRLGEPEEIAKVALFLVSDDASYVTGQIISANGGMRL
ncbi:MAG: 3-oxoacyl-ACP reductase FabG [Bacilli bacterium]